MRALSLLLWLLLAATAPAAPVPYALQVEDSVVAFEVDFGPDLIEGRMPVARADIRLDLSRLENSAVSVTLDVTDATTNNPFATQALKSPRVLDARDHPDIRFESTRITRTGPTEARVQGRLTMRGVTHPVTLTATLYRQRGTLPGDLSRLSILLEGAVSRSAFGATGWAERVGDEVRLRILARLRRAE